MKERGGVKTSSLWHTLIEEAEMVIPATETKTEHQKAEGEKKHNQKHNKEKCSFPVKAGKSRGKISPLFPASRVSNNL